MIRNRARDRYLVLFIYFKKELYKESTIRVLSGKGNEL